MRMVSTVVVEQSPDSYSRYGISIVKFARRREHLKNFYCWCVRGSISYNGNSVRNHFHLSIRPSRWSLLTNNTGIRIRTYRKINLTPLKWKLLIDIVLQNFIRFLQAEMRQYFLGMFLLFQQQCCLTPTFHIFRLHKISRIFFSFWSTFLWMVGVSSRKLYMKNSLEWITLILAEHLG